MGVKSERSSVRAMVGVVLGAKYEAVDDEKRSAYPATAQRARPERTFALPPLFIISCPPRFISEHLPGLIDLVCCSLIRPCSSARRQASWTLRPRRLLFPLHRCSVGVVDENPLSVGESNLGGRGQRRAAEHLVVIP